MVIPYMYKGYTKVSMEFKGIVIVGLGPAGASSLTREAWDWLAQSTEIWARTRYHPVFSELPKNIVVHSFDQLEKEFYSTDESLDIARKIIELAQEQGVVTYAVPGSPFIAEETVRQIMIQVKENQIPVRVIDGMSFLEPVCSALGLDPHPKLVLTDSLYLASLEIPFFPASVPALVSNLDQEWKQRPQLTLMNNYPTNTGQIDPQCRTTGRTCGRDSLHQIDQSLHTGLMSTLYLPARKTAEGLRIFNRSSPLARTRWLPWIANRLT